MSYQFSGRVENNLEWVRIMNRWGRLFLLAPAKLFYQLGCVALNGIRVEFIKWVVVRRNWPKGNHLERPQEFLGVAFARIYPTKSNLWVTRGAEDPDTSPYTSMLGSHRLGFAKLVLGNWSTEQVVKKQEAQRILELYSLMNTATPPPEMFEIFVQLRLDGTLRVMDGTHRLLTVVASNREDLWIKTKFYLVA